MNKNNTSTVKENSAVIRFKMKLVELQQRWAVSLQRRTERLSTASKIYLLVIFCIITVSCSLFIIADGLGNSNKNYLPVIIRKLPKYVGKASIEKTYSYPVVSSQEYARIKRFRFYLDSLLESSSGQKVRDSFNRSRPRLLDRMRLIERIYRSENLKK